MVDFDRDGLDALVDVESDYPWDFDEDDDFIIQAREMMED